MPICSQGVISSARRSAKAEVRGANPRESATFKMPLCLSSYRAGFVNPYSSVQVRPGAPTYQGRDVTVSISACDADCAGANPVALTIFNFTLCAGGVVNSYFVNKRLMGSNPVVGSRCATR